MQTITAREVYERISDPDSVKRPLVVDVREPDEWQSGHIAGAVHIPLGQVMARMQEIPSDREVVMVCHMGMRSERAANMLIRAGYQHVLNMVGGMDAWEGNSLPVER